MTPAQRAYRAFLKTDFWKELSAEKKATIGKCEKCGETEALQSHHIRYPSDWFDTTLADLQVLCRPCHRAEHGLNEVAVQFLHDNEEIDSFFWIAHEFIMELTALSAGHIPQEPIDLEWLQEVAAKYSDKPAVQFHMRQCLHWDQWTKENYPENYAKAYGPRRNGDHE